MLSSPLKPAVGSLPTAPEPNGSQPRLASSLRMLKLNKTLLFPIQLTGNGKEFPRQETTATAVSRRELIGLAATTLGGLAAEPAEAADIGSSIQELFGFLKGKPKTGADKEKKPKVEADEKKPKVESHGNKPKVEGDDKKASTPHHSDKEKVLGTSSAAPTLPNILNNTVP